MAKRKKKAKLFKHVFKTVNQTLTGRVITTSGGLKIGGVKVFD